MWWWSLGGFAFFSDEDFHFAELFVCNGEEADFTFFGEGLFNAVSVGFGSFFGRAVTSVDRELEHRESFCEERFAESGISFPLLCGIDGEVEHSEEPHTFISRKGYFFGWRHIISSGRERRSVSPAKAFTREDAVRNAISKRVRCSFSSKNLWRSDWIRVFFISRFNG